MQEEKFNSRCGAYSAWHRRMSTSRYVGIEKAQLLAMIDIDAALFVEYDDSTKEPIALIETAIDVGQDHKTATVTLKLAKRANLPCLLVLYTLASSKNPANPQEYDISSFRIKRLNPEKEHSWRILTPQEYCNVVLSMREYSALRIPF